MKTVKCEWKLYGSRLWHAWIWIMRQRIELIDLPGFISKQRSLNKHFK
jgi:hypothetical protein